MVTTRTGRGSGLTMNSDAATSSQRRTDIDCKTRNELGSLDNPNDIGEGPSNNNNNLDAGVAPAGQEGSLGHRSPSQPSSHASRRVDDNARQQLHDRIEQLEQDLISLCSSRAATSVSRSWSNSYQSSEWSRLPTCHDNAFKRAHSVRSRHDLTPLPAPSIMAVSMVPCPAVAPMAPPS